MVKYFECTLLCVQVAMDPDLLAILASDDDCEDGYANYISCHDLIT